MSDRLFPIPRDVSDVAQRAYGRVLRVDENWHTVGGVGEPALLSPWYVSSGSDPTFDVPGHPIRYVRDRDGRTHFVGQITSTEVTSGGGVTYYGFSEAPIFYLPPGWRPQDLIRFNSVYRSNEGMRGVIVEGFPDGLVRVRSYSIYVEPTGSSYYAQMYWVSLDGLWFWG